MNHVEVVERPKLRPANMLAKPVWIEPAFEDPEAVLALVRNRLAGGADSQIDADAQCLAHGGSLGNVLHVRILRAIQKTSVWEWQKTAAVTR